MQTEATRSNGRTELVKSDCSKHQHQQDRVFVNRTVRLGEIKFYGFDMDYTLAMYKSPAFETLTFNEIVHRLVDIGYPEELRSYEYDPSFPIRGIWFDMTYGNILKVNAFGYVMVAYHGFRKVGKTDLEIQYPNKFVQLDKSRMYVIDTLFNVPVAYVLTCLVDYFSKDKQYTSNSAGFKQDDKFISYKSLTQSARSSSTWVQTQSGLKKKTLANLEMYVERNCRLPLLLNNLRRNGAKVFLLTNSGWSYTEKIMTHVMSGSENSGQHWTTYFDYIFVNAQKPLFFGEGSMLKEIDMKTGALQLGTSSGQLHSDRVYSGGSCELFAQRTGSKGCDVLYIGDHVYGDVLRSKKIRGWKTFLVVPELDEELRILDIHSRHLQTLDRLDVQLTALYRLESTYDIANVNLDIRDVRKSIKRAFFHMDTLHGTLGSLFRSGAYQTFFACQIKRYADLYATSALDLLYYSAIFMFRATPVLMPHESVTFEDDPNDDRVEVSK